MYGRHTLDTGIDMQMGSGLCKPCNGIGAMFENYSSGRMDVRSSAKRRYPGLVNFIAAPVYHFCLGLPAAFTKPGDNLLAEL